MLKYCNRNIILKKNVEKNGRINSSFGLFFKIVESLFVNETKIGVLN